MSEAPSAETAIPLSDTEPRELVWFKKSLAAVVFVSKLAAASTAGAVRCFRQESGATQHFASALAESSTELAELTPETRAKLEAMLQAACQDIIEDGMRNAVTERLPDLLAKDPNPVIRALQSAIETSRTTPIIGSEVLKELGRFSGYMASHTLRRWVLERALLSPSAYIRDGAGLGLARLRDPGVLPSLRRAVENTPDPQARADLQLVIDELSEMVADGAPFAQSH
jgi:HEAT repeat protein